jgi:outer membrane protein assembly factor BamA
MGSSAGEGWFRIEGSIGAENAAGFGIASGRVSSRWRHEPQELLRLVNARWYVQWSGSHTLVLAVFAAEGSRVARDFQLVSGGLSGLRAYPVQAIAGHELVRANLEHRWRPHWQLGGLVRVGTAVFYDVAHGWGPGADPTNWFNAAGVGLRLVPPRSALGPVFRMDLAWPVSPTRDGQREVVLSFGSSQAF